VLDEFDGGSGGDAGGEQNRRKIITRWPGLTGLRGFERVAARIQSRRHGGRFAGSSWSVFEWKQSLRQAGRPKREQKKMKHARIVPATL